MTFGSKLLAFFTCKSCMTRTSTHLSSRIERDTRPATKAGIVATYLHPARLGSETTLRSETSLSLRRLLFYFACCFGSVEAQLTI